MLNNVGCLLSIRYFFFTKKRRKTFKIVGLCLSQNNKKKSNLIISRFNGVSYLFLINLNSPYLLENIVLSREKFKKKKIYFKKNNFKQPKVSKKLEKKKTPILDYIYYLKPTSIYSIKNLQDKFRIK